MDELAPGAALDERYMVVRHLSTGGMGAVYEVEHRALGKRLAAKLLRPELARRPDLIERFRREARAASATGHEHIVEVTDLGQTAERVPFLVMELLVGQTLGRLLKTARRLPPGRAVHIARQILSALGAAHGRGIVHRDLKPENVFLVTRGGDPDFVKLVDFGIAKLTDDEPELTRDGQVLGTPTYMAPEQARGDSAVDGRADLYAVGAMLYRMVTGQRPYSAANFNALLFAIAQGQLRRPSELAPDLSPQLEAAIVRAMAVDPRARFATAAQLDEALDEDDRTRACSPADGARRAWAASHPLSIEESGERPPSGGWQSRVQHGETPRPAHVRQSRSRMATAALGLAALVVIAGGAALLTRALARARAEAELRAQAADARARAAAAERALVHLTVAVEPAGARLTVDGAPVSGPALTLARDGARHVLRADADGYRPGEQPFIAGEDQSLALSLAPLPARPVARRGVGSVAAQRSPSPPQPRPRPLGGAYRSDEGADTDVGLLGTLPGVGAVNERKRARGGDDGELDPKQMKQLQKMIEKLGAGDGDAAGLGGLGGLLGGE